MPALVICALLLIASNALATVQVTKTVDLPANATMLFADVNGDGYDDFITGESVMPSRGNGELLSAVSYGPLTSRERIYGTADFNGDKRADLLVQECPDGSSHSLSARILLGTSQGHLVESMRFDAPQGVPAIGDIDGDGDPDVFFNSVHFDGAPPELAVFRNDNGTLVRDADIATQRPYVITELAVGDLDGDARPELVAIQGFWLATFSRKDDGTWSEGTYRLLPDLAEHLSLRDVDGDGANDLAFTSVMNGATLANVLFNDGKGHFRDVTAATAGAFDDSPDGLRQDVRSIAAADKRLVIALSDNSVVAFDTAGRKLREVWRATPALDEVSVTSARLTRRDASDVILTGYDRDLGFYVSSAFAIASDEAPAPTGRRRAASPPRPDLSGDYTATFDCGSDSFSTVWTLKQDGIFLDATPQRGDETLDAVTSNGAINVRFVTPMLANPLFVQLRAGDGAYVAAVPCGTVTLRAR